MKLENVKGSNTEIKSVISNSNEMPASLLFAAKSRWTFLLTIQRKKIKSDFY